MTHVLLCQSGLKVCLIRDCAYALNGLRSLPGAGPSASLTERPTFSHKQVSFSHKQSQTVTVSHKQSQTGVFQ